MNNFISLFLLPFITSYILTYLTSILVIKTLSNLVSKNKPELIEFHSDKAKIPNVGGIAFVFATLVATFIFAPISRFLIYLLSSILSFSLLGFVDDFYKRTSNNGDGIKSLTKLVWQFLIAIFFVIYGTQHNYISSGIPYLNGETIFQKVIENVALIFLMVYFVNAFNITDGLDGLAGYVSLPICVLLILVSMLLPNNEVITVVTISISASLIAFLHFNKYPAKYFMGDCGSMALGVTLLMISLSLKVSIIFLIASLMLSIELFTSLIQILAIRIFNKKVFSIAPIHHLYEKKGNSETKIVLQFTRISTLFSIIALLVFCSWNI